MDKYNKYIFKKSPILLKDFLRAKNFPNKSLKYFQSLTNTKINTNYHVNELAKELHPKKQLVQLKEVIKMNDHIYSFVLMGYKDKLAIFRPGQYLSVTIDINQVKISRPYSISSSVEYLLENNAYVITVNILKTGYFSNYLLNHVKIGDVLEVSGPEGEFYYDNLRDSNKLLFVAGGIGITPFMSLIQDLLVNEPNIDITLLYSAKTFDDLIFINELNELSNKHNNFQAVYFLTREDKQGYINSRISFEYFKKYYNKGSIFICGSKIFCNEIRKFATTLKVLRKLVRFETIEKPNIEKLKELQQSNSNNSYNIKVHLFDQVYNIKANYDDSILVSLQKAKLHTQSKCLSGRCAWCRIKLIKGEVYVDPEADHRRKADKTNNIYHSCVTYPLSDLEIETY